MIIKDSPVPLYYQLAEYIRAQIQAGELKPGDRLPSEREFSEQAGVSRMTARQALAYLTRAGLLIVRHGVGTFVAMPKVTYSLLNLRSFTETMAQLGKPIFSRVLIQAVTEPPANIAEALHLPAGAPTVKIVRLRGVDTLPLLLETSYVSSALCPGLENAELAERSLYKLFEEDHGLLVSHATQGFEASIANEYERTVFELEHETPMLLLEGVTYTTTDIPLESFKTVYRGDRCSFVFQSSRDGVEEDSPVAKLNVRV